MYYFKQPLRDVAPEWATNVIFYPGNRLSYSTLLHHIDEVEYTGNESVEEEGQYLTCCFVIGRI